MRRNKSSKSSFDSESQSVKPLSIADSVKGDAICRTPRTKQHSQRCPLSNTAPSKVHLQSLPGIDYLTFWVFGHVDEKDSDLFSFLDDKKEEAKKEKESNQKKEIEIVRGNDEFLLSPHNSSGSGFYRCRWQLSHEGIYIGVCKNLTNDLKRPIAKIEIKGSVLMQLGLIESLKKVDHCLASLGICYYKSKVSRLDVKVDQFFLPVDVYVKSLIDDKVITRARSYESYGSISRLETIVFGNRKTNRFICRIYDKLSEINKNPIKEMLFYNCITNGENPDHCTRVEFEIRREGFTELGIETIEDCFGQFDKLIRYLSFDFLRFTAKPVDRNHTERSKTSRGWLDAQNTLLNFAASFKATEPSPLNCETVDATFHQKCMEGHLASWMVKEGVIPECPDTLLSFIIHRFAGDIDVEKFGDKFVQVCKAFKHKQGLAVASISQQQKENLKQALSGVRKIVRSERRSDIVAKPEDLVNQKELMWKPKEKRAA